ncbi:uncharacterized protein LOC134826675 [Bolinopsis microptera]|uniref:uncharacterized protein LOC134826675 n=1 Tax=Bolinopsis microptera TaxID=2820187 RepID=UPI003078D4E9
MTLVPKSESDSETEMMNDCSQPEARKRKRADYSKLSPDERNLKRKLKNRMSAQQARDRKKLYVSELEERIAQLEKENSNLRRICSMQLRGTDDSAVITGPLPWALLLLQLLARVYPHKNPSPNQLGGAQPQPRLTHQHQHARLMSLYSKVLPGRALPGKPPTPGRLKQLQLIML